MIRSVAVVCVLIAAAFSLPGCAVPVAVAATAGLSAAQAGSSAWVRGELREAVYIDLETVHAATLLAMDDLQVNVRTNRLSERSAYIMGHERRGPEVKVSLARRTPQVTRIGVRLGIMGDMATSRVVMERIFAHLREPPIVGDSED